MRAAIYCRISRDPSGTALGVQRQEKDCRTLCKANGWDVAAIFTDNDLSAYSGKPRPRYRALTEAVKANEIDAVVCWHPDRLHRSPRELEDFISLVESTGVTIATVQAGAYDLTTATGMMSARIVGAVARHESDQKSERIRRKHEQLAEAGDGKGGGTRPFGFKADRITVDKPEAKLIQEAAGRVLRGESVRGIVISWTSRGIASPAGKPWTPSSLRRMLISPRIAGLRQHRGVVVAKATWAAILDEKTHRRLVSLLTDPARRTNRASRKYLLSGGLLRCGLPDCGAALVARPRADGRPAYVCAKGPGNRGCGRTATLAAPVERLARDFVIDRVQSDQFIAQLRASREPAADDAVDVAEVEATMAQLARDHYNDKLIGRAEYLAARDALQATLDAEQRAVAHDTGTTVLAEFLGDGEALLREWKDGMDLSRRRAIVVAAINCVIVYPAVKGRNTFDASRFEPDPERA